MLHGQETEGPFDVVFAIELLIEKRELEVVIASGKPHLQPQVELHGEAKSIEARSKVGDRPRNFDFQFRGSRRVHGFAT